MGNAKITAEKFKEKFWHQVDIKDKTQCWEWKAGKNKGYGCVKVPHLFFTQLAHRISWIITFGEISEDLFCLHKCDNRSCVNPSHLYIGTAKDNAIDKETRNSFVRGPKRVLDKETVDKIVFMCSLGIHKAKIARMYSVSPNTIKRAV